jgi:hypothetical protein
MSIISLAVEYAVTCDMVDGQPLPPYIDDSVTWRIVRRLPGGRTRWRRTHLSSQVSQPSGGRTDSVGDAL